MRELKLLVLILMIAYLAPIGCFFPMIPILEGPLWISIPYFSGAITMVIFQHRILKWIQSDHNNSHKCG